MKDAKGNVFALKEMQAKCLQYFLDLANLENGLVPDTNEKGAPASIAGVGFALTCYPICVKNKLVSREEAALRTLATLRFFWKSEQGPGEATTGYRGFYYHFLDMTSGKRTWDCELSFIDSGLLFAGVACAAVYFDGEKEEESEIRDLAQKILGRADWEWASEGKVCLSQGWFPESGFIHYDWEGYSEALILYALALGEEEHPLKPESFAAWTSTYQWENIYDVDLLYAGPLFIHFFSQAWIDFRGIRDAFMREKKSDYFENTRRAIQVQRKYCDLNPKDFEGYGRNFWGLTADAGPGYGAKVKSGTGICFFDYAARGVPFGPDDGTIAPWVALAALPFDEAAGLDFLAHLEKNYPQLFGRYGLKCSFNPTAQPPWNPDRFYALDVGLSAVMVENAQTGMIWDLMKKCSALRRGLRTAGFRGGWL